MSTLYHPRLSVDVILTILPHLDQSSALAVSTANKDLREHAVPIVLQKPVVLRSPQEILSFIAFLKSGGSYTPHCDRVHELDITLPPAFPQFCHISLLSTTLVKLTGLRTLTLRNPEVIFNQAASFRRVFEGLKTIDAVTIDGAGPQSIKLLQGSKSPLRSVRILDPLWRFPLAAALGGSDCEALVAYNCHVPPMAYPSDDIAPLPALHYLHVPRFCIDVDHRAGFMSLAPNLHVLDIGAEYAASLTWTAELAAHRAANKAATLGFRREARGGLRRPAWTQLGLVRGGLVDLLVFGNTCPVFVLELVGVPVAGATLQRLVPEVVLDHEPRVLRFSLAGPEIDVDTFVPERNRLVAVESLYVRIVLTSAPTEAEWAACEYSLAELAYSFPGCRALCVEFEAVEPAVRDFLAGKDREQIAGGIAERSERVLVICVSTPTGPAYWRVDGDVGGRRELGQPQLSNKEGRRLLTGWSVFSESYPLCDPSSE